MIHIVTVQAYCTQNNGVATDTQTSMTITVKLKHLIKRHLKYSSCVTFA